MRAHDFIQFFFIGFWNITAQVQHQQQQQQPNKQNSRHIFFLTNIPNVPKWSGKKMFWKKNYNTNVKHSFRRITKLAGLIVCVCVCLLYREWRAYSNVIVQSISVAYVSEIHMIFIYLFFTFHRFSCRKFNSQTHAAVSVIAVVVVTSTATEVQKWESTLTNRSDQEQSETKWNKLWTTDAAIKNGNYTHKRRI